MKKETKYKAILKTGKETYNSEGETLEELFDNFDLEWYNIKVKGELRVSYGKKETLKVFQVKEIQGIIKGNLQRKKWIPNFTKLLNS